MLVGVERLGDRHRLLRVAVGAARDLLRLLLRLIEREHRGSVGRLEVVGLREALGPVRAAAARGLHDPGAVGPVSAIEQLDAARQRRAGVGYAADRKLEAGGGRLEARST